MNSAKQKNAPWGVFLSSGDQNGDGRAQQKPEKDLKAGVSQKFLQVFNFDLPVQINLFHNLVQRFGVFARFAAQGERIIDDDQCENRGDGKIGGTETINEAASGGKCGDCRRMGTGKPAAGPKTPERRTIDAVF